MLADELFQSSFVILRKAFPPHSDDTFAESEGPTESALRNRLDLTLRTFDAEVIRKPSDFVPLSFVGSASGSPDEIFESHGVVERERPPWQHVLKTLFDAQ